MAQIFDRSPNVLARTLLVLTGLIATACQQACPMEAITFGNINDQGSRVAKLRADERVLLDRLQLHQLKSRPLVQTNGPHLTEIPEPEHAHA